MVSVPKLFMQLWMTMLLRLYMVLWAAAGMPDGADGPQDAGSIRILSSETCQGHALGADDAAQGEQGAGHLG